MLMGSKTGVLPAADRDDHQMTTASTMDCSQHDQRLPKMV